MDVNIDTTVREVDTKENKRVLQKVFNSSIKVRRPYYKPRRSRRKIRGNR